MTRTGPALTSREVEHVEVLGNSLRAGRLRDRGTLPLQVSAQHHLRRCLAVRLADAGDGRVVEGSCHPRTT
jgi:hypothetical protein